MDLRDEIDAFLDEILRILKSVYDKLEIELPKLSDLSEEVSDDFV